MVQFKKCFHLTMLLMFSHSSVFASGVGTLPSAAYKKQYASEIVAEHAEIGIKLPDDFMYCDLNDNKKIDADEISADNLCDQELEHANTFFAQKPISALGLQKGQLLLTIDDGPNPTITPLILDLLKSYNIKATLFLTGNQVPSKAAIVKRMFEEGHTVGNHTFSHNVGQITASTIGSEITQAHNAVAKALGPELTDVMMNKRLLFRAPGLAWNTSKADSLNNNSFTRKFVGPIHANLGTDAPRADWSCWSQGVSAETCANWYFEDISKAGRGIVLSHDIFYRPGKGNTYELLKILLKRLDDNGGIKNKNGQGVWEFVDVQDLTALDQYEDIKKAGNNTHQTQTPTPQPAPPVVTPPVVDQGDSGATNATIIRSFNRVANVRSHRLVELGTVNSESLIKVNVDGEATQLVTAVLTAVEYTGNRVQIEDGFFRAVRILETKPGFESMKGKTVYIWEVAF